MPSARLPPGPRAPFGVNPLTFHRHRLEILLRVAREYGDIASFLLGPVRVVLLNHPDLVREVLVTREDDFVKGRGIDELRRVLGQGLLSSEGDLHRRQRRLIQPLFRHERIAAYAADMVEVAERTAGRFRDGETFDVAREMMRLTLAIVGKTLFGVDVEGEAAEVGESLSTVMRWTMNRLSPFGGLLEKLPLAANRRFRESLGRLDALIERMITDRRRDPGHGDLLALLLAAQDVEGDGGGMSDRQVRDEAMTLFLAGHETTAQALTFTFWLLGHHPEVEGRLHAELDSVLDGRAPRAEDYGKLVYTRQVLWESMRIYPPAWIIGRRALVDLELGGHRVPAGALVLASPFVSHRDPRFFPDPERFDPDRFAASASADRPRYAYYPFGGGSRVCIGEGFAAMEGTLVLASLARRFRLRPVPGQTLELEPLVTLRPRHGLRVTAVRRD